MLRSSCFWLLLLLGTFLVSFLLLVSFLFVSSFISPRSLFGWLFLNFNIKIGVNDILAEDDLAKRLGEVEVVEIEGHEPRQMRESALSCFFIHKELKWSDQHRDQVDVSQGQLVAHQVISQLEVLLEYRKAVSELAALLRKLSDFRLPETQNLL